MGVVFYLCTMEVMDLDLSTRSIAWAIYGVLV